jgi:hypothetical protein
MEPITLLFIVSSVLSSGAFVGEYETDEGIPYQVFRDFVTIEQIAPDQSSLEFDYKGDSVSINLATTENQMPSELMIPILYKVF